MSTPSQARHALLIGIDAYPKLNPLDGCVNDVHLMRSILQEQYGFTDGDITQLLDAEATREAILRELDAMVERVGTDDIVVIQYAGHGCQMTDREGDEPDGLDETLMPWDSEGWQGDNRDITDDEINLRLVELAKKTPYTTLIVDACHSGTITRDSFGSKARTMPPDLRPASELPPSPIPPEKRGALRGRGPSGWMPLADSYVLIAGCRDDEVSYEYAAPAGEGTVAHGTMTWFLAQELRKAEPGATYRDVFERVAAQVNAANERQHPQMEGRVDREIFGIRDREPMRFARVLARTGDTVKVAAGSAHGATVGSRYAVYPQGTKRTEDATAVAEVEITAVRVVESDARILSGGDDPALAADARAVETHHAHGAFRLNVEVVADDPAAGAALRETLSGSPLLRICEGGTPTPAVRAYVLEPRDEAGEKDQVPQLGALDEATVAVVDGAGIRLMPPRRPDEAAVVLENLERIARYRQILALENPDTRSHLRGRFGVDLLRLAADGTWVTAQPEEAGGLVVYEEGDAIAFRVYSDHDSAVFFSLLDFGLTGGVSLIYPAPGKNESEKLDANTAFEIGTRPGDEPFTVGIPAELADDVTEAVETVKLFVTTVPADLSVLSQTGVRSGVPGPGGSALDELLAGAARGGTRDIVRPVAREEWTTAVRPFVVRRKGAQALASDGTPLNVGSVSLVTEGIQGTVTAKPGASGHTEAAAPTPEALSRALADAGMTVQDTVLLREPRPASGGSRGAEAGATMEVAVRAPAPGHDQLILAVDDLGVVSWHLPQATMEGEAASRDGMVRYSIPYGEKGRGVAASVALVALKVLVFPRLEAAAGKAAQSLVARWEEEHRPHRVRAFGPDDHQKQDVPSLGPDDWKRLAEGRALLFIHGTTSMAHSAFGDLPTDVMAQLHERYAGRVFALDHPTVSADPKDNVGWFLEQIPSGTQLDVDIVCHSRGGLVSRVLAERQGEFGLADRSVKVGKVVFVGSPNAGTKLADSKFMGSFLDTYTNLVCRLPGGPALQALQVIPAVLKQLAVGMEAGLDGLRSMVPDGDFNRWLNDGAGTTDARYLAIASDFKPADPGLIRLANTALLDKIFEAPHDLVVAAPSVFDRNGAAAFPIQERVVYSGAEAMSHVSYFGDPKVQEQLLTWLSG